MLIVCLAGVGASVAAGGAAALTVVSLTLCMQLLVFLWIMCLCPSIDRVDNFAVALGWGVESCSMLLLVLASFRPSLQTDSLEAAACALSLLGVGVPLLKLSYEALLAPLGSCFFRYIDGEARTNPCSMGTLLQLLRLLLTVGHKLAATCCACAGSSGGATSGMASGHVADSGVVYGGRDDGHPRKKGSSSTRPEETPLEASCGEKRRSSTDSKDGHEIWPDFLLTESSGGEAPSQTLARAGAAPGAVSGAAPGTAPESDRAAGVDAARSSDSARGTRRRLTERSPRGPTPPEPPPVRV